LWCLIVETNPSTSGKAIAPQVSLLDLITNKLQKCKFHAISPVYYGDNACDHLDDDLFSDIQDSHPIFQFSFLMNAGLHMNGIPRLMKRVRYRLVKQGVAASFDILSLIIDISSLGEVLDLPQIVLFHFQMTKMKDILTLQSFKL
jgi:hypothetical protein